MKPIFLWKRLPLRDRSHLPSKPGLYAVVSLWRVFYVGRAVDLRDRWQGKGHHRYRQARHLVMPYLAYIELPKQRINGAEKELIRRVDPPWNGSPVPKPVRWWKFIAEMAVAVVACFLLDKYSEEILYWLGSFGAF